MHRGSYTRTYASWQSMRNRCLNLNADKYKKYGGRGIKICERWENYENFLLDMSDRPPNLTLDRIDNDGDYEPSNCRWATPKEQAGNRSNNRYLTYKGKTKILTEWAREFNLKYQVLAKRIELGWSEEKALETRPLKRHQWR